jgi:hypothetical protein
MSTPGSCKAFSLSSPPALLLQNLKDGVWLLLHYASSIIKRPTELIPRAVNKEGLTFLLTFSGTSYSVNCEVIRSIRNVIQIMGTLITDYIPMVTLINKKLILIKGPPTFNNLG